MEHTSPRETDDSNDLPKPLLLAAPMLHAALLPSWAPAGIRCLNPGILSQRELASDPLRYFTPSELPLSHPQARAQLQELLTFASMHNKPGEISSLAATGAPKPFASESLDFRKELVDIAKISGKVLSPDSETDKEENAGPDPELIRSQMTLLLAWVQEERLMELGQLSQKLNQTWNTFDQALGLEPDEEDSGIAEIETGAYERSFGGSGTADQTALSCDLVLQHLLRFVPSETWLIFFDKQQQQVFQDAGIVFEPVEPEVLQGEFLESGISGQMASTSLGKLIGKKDDPAESWLSRTVRVFFPDGE